MIWYNSFWIFVFFQVICLDGDGSVLMHMGAMATIGHRGPSNFIHILLNNECHDSVGGQPTDAANEGLSFTGIASACGYKHVWISIICSAFNLEKQTPVTIVYTNRKVLTFPLGFQ